PRASTRPCSERPWAGRDESAPPRPHGDPACRIVRMRERIDHPRSARGDRLRSSAAERLADLGEGFNALSQCGSAVVQWGRAHSPVAVVDLTSSAIGLYSFEEQNELRRTTPCTARFTQGKLTMRIAVTKSHQRGKPRKNRYLAKIGALPCDSR